MKTRRGYMVIAILCGLLTVMTGVCFADVANPGVLLFLTPFLVCLFIYALAAMATVMALVIGLYLCIWKLIHPKAKRMHSSADHVDVILSLFLGLLCSGIIVGLPIYFRALKTAAQYFFDDVRGSDTERPKWNALICVAGEIVVSVAIGVFLFHTVLVERIREFVRNTSFLRDLVDRLAEGNPPWVLYLFCAISAVWFIVLLVKHIRYREDTERLKKRFPDELTVFGFLFLAFWWWCFCGLLFCFPAWYLAKIIISEDPIRIKIKRRKEDPEANDALRKIQSLDGVIKKDGQSEDE